jgi:hypothetical protein
MGVDLHQPPRPTAPTMGDDNVDVSGASCPGHSFSTELDNAEINARIQGILVHGANHNPSPARSL